MGFGWLGTFRQGQWREYRSFVLNERRVVAQRMAVIQAELTRIGRVTVGYLQKTDADTGVTTVTEQRTGFSVSQGSNLEKLIQAYVAQGGNPFNISLFLTPDSVFIVDEDDDSVPEMPTQPYGGVIYPQTGSTAVGTSYEGGYLVVKKYPPSRLGGRKDPQDSHMAGAVATTRKWVSQVVQTRLHDLEARIIKQCDLREQLLNELDTIVMAAGGTVGALPSLDSDFYDESFGVARIVAAIDSVFYELDSDGVPDFSTTNNAMQEVYPSVYPDIDGEEDNTAL